MSTNTQSRILNTIPVFWVFAAVTSFFVPAQADKLELAQTPLYLTNSAPPNIMLMLDSSGSMTNVVPEVATAPQYDSTVTALASCPTANQVPLTNAVDLNIGTDGKPYITYGGKQYLWGTGSGQRCFVTASTYGAVPYAYRLNADLNVASDGTISGSCGSFCTVASGYLGTSYSGNYLNWYFNPTSVSGVTWSGRTDQRVKPLVANASCPGKGTPNTNCVKTRIQIARQGAADLIGTLDDTLRVGFSTYNGGAGGEPYGGTIFQGVAPLGPSTSSTRASLVSYINATNAGGATPLAETLADIGRYFTTGYAGNLTLHPDATTPQPDTVAKVFSLANNGTAHGFADPNSVVPSNSCSTTGGGTSCPVSLSCQRSIAVVLTDGRPNNDQSMSTDLQNYTGDCTAAHGCKGIAGGGTATQGYYGGQPTGTPPRSYEAAGSDYLDDVAQALYEMDLRPDFAVESSTNKQFKNNVTTYMIGFADPAVVNDPLVINTAKVGGGQFKVAGDSASLASAFADIVTNILSTTGSFSSAAASSTQLNTGTQVLQASFDSGNWSGDLQSFQVSDGKNTSCPSGGGTPTLGALCPFFTWSASNNLKLQSSTSRNILTYDPAKRSGTPFRYASLSALQLTQLKQAATDSVATVTNRVSFLRGDTSQDKKPDTPRDRNGFVLGDIIGSSPVYVGAPSANYSDPTYAAFRTNSTYANRLPMAYVGANDGMLHGFDASSGSNKGNEIFAYVPNTSFGTGTRQPLYNLTQTPFKHLPIVDGALQVADAQISSNWTSVLVGGLGAGGRGIYALDVTNPAAITESTTSKVLWEFTNLDDVDLGYTYGPPSIVKMKNGQWAAIFGNGYTTDSTTEIFGTGQACLFIAFLEGPTTGVGGSWGLGTGTGTRYRKICTGVGTVLSPNGLGSPAAVATDGSSDQAVDFIYAGDERGNMWRFDVNNTDPTMWKVAYGGNPLFTATDGTNPQPITEQPEVGYNLNAAGATSKTAPKLTVYFGTGRYLGSSAGGISDNSTTGVQTFYGIFDNDLTGASTASPGTSRSNLRRQYIVQEINASGSTCTGSAIAASGSCFRVTTQNGITSSDRGWFIDLYNTMGSGVSTPGSSVSTYGERQVTTPVLRNGRIIFTTLIPSSDPCNAGGGGWLMELDAKSGGRTNAPAFNTNSDQVVDQSDTVTIGGVTISLSGSRSNVGVPSTPAIISLSGGLEIKHYTGTGRGGVTRDSLLESAAGRTGRITWREIQQ